MSEQNTRNGNADVFKKAWRGFQGAKWTDEVNVREFIQNNYTSTTEPRISSQLRPKLPLNSGDVFRSSRKRSAKKAAS